MINNQHLNSRTAIFWLMLTERQARTIQVDWLVPDCLALSDQSTLPGSPSSFSQRQSAVKPGLSRGHRVGNSGQ